MSRIRSIKPESCLSETLAELSDRACLLFAYLPCFCDDEGRMRYTPRLIKAQVFPLRDGITVDDCEAMVKELEEHRLVIVYTAEGQKLLQVTNFLEHQHPQKPKASQYPAPLQYMYDTDTGNEKSVESEEQEPLSAQTCNTVQVKDADNSGIACNSNSNRSSSRNRSSKENNVDGDTATVETMRRIVTYLNHKTGKNFKHSTAATQRLIKTRFKEGWTFEDFQKVIDVKCAQWLRKPDMSGYLRPETLFGSKFEGYLNEWTPTASEQGGASYADYN